MVHPLDHQLAAEFWGITDPRLAVKVNAIVGGTPAYRREFARNDVPAGPDDFDAWLTRTVLTESLKRQMQEMLGFGLYAQFLALMDKPDGTNQPQQPR